MGKEFANAENDSPQPSPEKAPMSEAQTSWRARLAAPALAGFMVLCCLAAPILVGAAGALTAGALLGLGATALAILGLCLYVARRVRSDRGC